MKKALLVVDIQQDFTDKNGRMSLMNQNDAEKMIVKINTLIEQATKQSDLVIYIGNEFSRYDPLNIFRNFAAIENSNGVKADKRLLVVNDNYFSKNKGDAFSNPKLNSLLKHHQVDALMITGVYAEACIWHTIKGARKNGFNIEVCPDAIAAKKEKRIKKMLRRYQKAGVRLSTNVDNVAC